MVWFFNCSAGGAPDSCQLCNMHGSAIIPKENKRIHKASLLSRVFVCLFVLFYFNFNILIFKFG